MTTTTAGLTRDLIVTHTRALKLPGVARTFEALARQAREAHWPYEDYLHEVLSAEHTSRHESVIRQRLREARFPEVKTLDTFDFGAAEGLSAPQLHTLARGEWVTQPENLILAGPIGTGKTHLAIALGVEATKQKRRVLFTRAADLVRQLLEARDARELGRLQRRLLTLDVLIVDELGFVPFDRVGGELLFNLITDRYERRATVVTTNLLCSAPHKRFNAERSVMRSYVGRRRRSLFRPRKESPAGDEHGLRTPHYRDAFLKGGRHAVRPFRVIRTD